MSRPSIRTWRCRPEEGAVSVEPRVVLGIDPGLATTGYGVLSASVGRVSLLDAGVIRSKRSLPLPARLAELHDGLMSVIMAFHPCIMGLEEVYSHYAHPVTAISMAHARGVFCLAAQKSGLRMISLPATTIKKLVTGNGRASKQQVAGMVARLLGIANPGGPFDVTDALAAAIAAAESERQ